tara:strand:+ start:185 stop:523 length:339 start_codon:yes stop_codon:yes gene_type:complete
MAETFKRGGASLSTTSATDLFQAQAGSGDVAIVLSVHCANKTNSSANLTVDVTNSSGVVQTCLLYGAGIPANTSMEIVQNKVVLLAGEKISATADTGDVFDITVSALDVTAS